MSIKILIIIINNFCLFPFSSFLKKEIIQSSVLNVNKKFNVKINKNKLEIGY